MLPLYSLTGMMKKKYFNSFAEDLARYMSFVDDDTLLDIASDWIFNIFGVEC